MAPAGVVCSISRPAAELVRRSLFLLSPTPYAIDSGGPIVRSLSYRGIALIRGGDTQAHHAEDNRQYVMGALNWHPSAATSLTLRASATRDRDNRPTGFIPYRGAVKPLSDGRRIPTRLFVSDPAIDRYDRNQYELGYDFRQRLSPRVRFVSKSRYARLDLDYAGLYGQFSGNPVVMNGAYFLNRGNSRQIAGLKNATSDNRFVIDFDTGPLQHTVLAGVDYSRSRTAGRRAAGAAPPLNIFDPDYDLAIPPLGPDSHNRQILIQTGFYLQDQLKAGPWVLALSGRHDRLDITTAEGGTPAEIRAPAKNTYRAGLVYVADNGLAPYISYATSFMPVIGAERVSGSAYQPETGHQIETGLRYRPESLPITASAAIFDIRRSGVLIADPQPGFPFNRSQGGEQRSRGGELAVEASPWPALSVNAAVTAFDLETVRGEPGTLGKTPVAKPRIIAALFADYTVPGEARLGGLGFGAGVRYTGESYADDANTLSVPAATVFDTALHYNAGSFNIALNVSNVFNEHYIAACPSAGTCYVGSLRRATLSLEYRM